MSPFTNVATEARLQPALQGHFANRCDARRHIGKLQILRGRQVASVREKGPDDQLLSWLLHSVFEPPYANHGTGR